MKRLRIAGRTSALITIWLIGIGIAGAAIKMPALFSPHMVLQRDATVSIWGKADPGEQVLVEFAGQSNTATAGTDGKWKVRLASMPASSEPCNLVIRSARDNRQTIISNVVVGEVWLCSGQSNMQLQLGLASNGVQEAAAADDPLIRLYLVPRRCCLEPQDECAGQWTVCTPKTAPGFSAAAFFFARRLRSELNVPVGLIQSDHGGSPAEAWGSREALAALPDFAPLLPGIDQLKSVRRFADDKAMAAVETNEAEAEAMSAPGLETSRWKEMILPGTWEQAGLPLFRGLVWFRKEADLPADWAGKALQLSLPAINGVDAAWLNGVKVGATGCYSKGDLSWKNAYTPRQYAVPAGVARSGRNIVVMRVLSPAPESAPGLWRAFDPMTLTLVGGKGQKPVSLAGAWRFLPGPQMGYSHYTPTALFNGMIHPVIPYGIRGALWYQGESNTGGRTPRYTDLFAALIGDWRARWQAGDFPFLFVQLPNYASMVGWPQVREDQLKTLKLTNTAMAVTIDVGDPRDIHPKDKAPVGLRLALAALATVYGRTNVYSGPIYDSMSVEGNRIRLKFRYVGSGLTAKGGDLKWFEIAGANKAFTAAKAAIDGDTVVVWNDKITSPAAVRYAWAQDPAGCNLYNREGLPASPFRTADWP